jgi:hypothetical protein
MYMSEMKLLDLGAPSSFGLIRSNGPCALRRVYNDGLNTVATHTYLDGIGPFMSRGLWAVESLHSTATLSIQREATVCMGSGSCTV